MPIHARKNQYLGVNAHLHSLLQRPGTDENPSSWRGFHNQQITHLMEALNMHLPEGYIAVNEQSLQILGEIDGGIPIRRKPIPDIAIYQQQAVTTGERASEHGQAVVTWETTLNETLVPDNTIDAVVIYAQGEHEYWGKPVTQIELLSPSNKPGGTNYESYSAKRNQTLLSGVTLIEIDYLHETLSPIVDFPIYPQTSNSSPFYIAISTPHPKPKGRVQAFGFRVDTPIPTLFVPLAEDQGIVFSFDDPYQTAYERGPWHVLVDYEQLPANFESYDTLDRQRIQARMARVAQAVTEASNLESGPFVIENTV